MKNIILISLIFFYWVANSQTIILTDSIEQMDIASKVLVFEDTNNSYDFKNIVSKDSNLFQPNKSKSIKYSKGSLWIRMSLKNNTTNKYYLKSNNTAISDIEVFKFDHSGAIQTIKTGIFKPFETREFDNTQFIFNVSTSNTVYIRLRVAMKGSSTIPLSIYSEKALTKEVNQVNLLNGVYFGVLFLIIIICIFNFIFLKERIYLTYLCFVLANLVIINFSNGNLTKYLLQSYPQLTNYPLAITMWAGIFYHLFMIDFLQIKKYYPKVLFVNYLLISLILTVVLGDIVGIDFLAFAPLIILCNHIFSFTMSILIFRSGFKPAIFYIIGNLFVFIGTFAIFGLVFDIVPSNIFTANALQICLLAEMIFFTLGLSNKTYLLKLENQEAWEYFAHSLEENQNILINQKQELEKQVQERTVEIEAQNEELLQQQEELNSLNESLNQQKSTIEHQNKLLKLSNEQLERKVSERTAELILINDRLLKQNSLLEQYSYITSHNLRGPIARILGLNNVLDLNDPSNPQNKEILLHLNKTTLALDAIVKDLSIVLNINKNLELSGEETYFSKLVENVITSIDASSIQIFTDFSEVDKIHTIKPYMHSIFYNLISNAVKYRSQLQPSSFLKISSHIEDQNIILKFEDNGIGMDLEAIGNRVFKAFERFHTESAIDGKGIGLFLVNLQIQNLEGQLIIESEPNKGTLFKIVLPKMVGFSTEQYHEKSN